MFDELSFRLKKTAFRFKTFFKLLKEVFEFLIFGDLPGFKAGVLFLRSFEEEVVIKFGTKNKEFVSRIIDPEKNRKALESSKKSFEEKLRNVTAEIHGRAPKTGFDQYFDEQMKNPRAAKAYNDARKEIDAHDSKARELLSEECQEWEDWKQFEAGLKKKED